MCQVDIWEEQGRDSVSGNIWEELECGGAGGQGTYGKSYSLRSDRSTSPPVKCQEELFQLSDELFAR